VILYGYDDLSQQVHIHDPIYGSFTVPYGTSFYYNSPTGPLVWDTSIVF
jgi:hypothetical protein